MPRDLSLEKTLLEILELLSPQPMRETVLAHEAEIRLDRCLVTTDVQDALQGLQERRFVGRNISKMGLPQCWITEAGRIALQG